MSAYVQHTSPTRLVSSPTLVPSQWKTTAINDTINRLEEEEQHWLQQNRSNNKCYNRGMEASSEPSSPSENYNVFGLKFWKWNISLKIPASTGIGNHHKLHDLHEQYGPHHCPLKKERKEERTLNTIGSKRDSQWEFFGFGNAKRNGGARQAIKNRAKSIANKYYKPIDDQEEADNESDVANDRLGNGENVYSEIEDDVYHMWSPEPSESQPKSNRVCMEPLPTIQHVTKIQVPPIPPKSPIRRKFLASDERTLSPPPILPPYPSSVAVRKSRRKSMNIDKVDGKLKRRHSVKN